MQHSAPTRTNKQHGSAVMPVAGGATWVVSTSLRHLRVILFAQCVTVAVSDSSSKGMGTDINCTVLYFVFHKVSVLHCV